MSRSESVVFPWSMCAMIEKLRMFFIGAPANPPFYRGCVWSPRTSGRGARPGSAGGSARPADRDDVDAGAAQEQAPSFLVEAVLRVVAQQAVRHHLQHLERVMPCPLGVGAGHDHGHAAV